MRKENIFPSLVSAHSIKPIDRNMLIRIFKKYDYIVTLEEHSRIGGLSSAISEFYLTKNIRKKFLSLNTGENFIVKSGKQIDAIKMLNLSSQDIKKRIYA